MRPTYFWLFLFSKAFIFNERHLLQRKLCLMQLEINTLLGIISSLKISLKNVLHVCNTNGISFVVLLTLKKCYYCCYKVIWFLHCHHSFIKLSIFNVRIALGFFKTRQVSCAFHKKIYEVRIYRQILSEWVRRPNPEDWIMNWE